jgi:hypothetical protein
MEADVNVATQGIGHWTALLSFASGFLEASLIEPRHVPMDGEVHSCYPRTAATILEGADSSYIQASWWMAILGKCIRERHGVADSVGRCDQFLWARLSTWTLRARSPANWYGANCIAGEAYLAVSSQQVTIPYNFSSTLCNRHSDLHATKMK